jgi:hypothetical protein
MFANSLQVVSVAFFQKSNFSNNKKILPDKIYNTCCFQQDYIFINEAEFWIKATEKARWDLATEVTILDLLLGK